MGGCDDVSRKTAFMTTTFSKLYYDINCSISFGYWPLLQCISHI